MKMQRVKVRRGWGNLKPVTRIMRDKTKYMRKSKFRSLNSEW